MSGSEATAPVTGMKALEQAFLDYRAQGLRVPSVPHTLVDKLTHRGGDTYTTEPMSLEDRAAVIALAADPRAPDQIGFGQIGHGIASWYFCLRMIAGPLAVFVRLNYGGAYGDADSERDDINAVLLQTEELVVAAAEARASGRLPKGERALVVFDVLEGNMWRVDARGAEVVSDDPFSEALDWLQGATGAG